jgi:hypothetical protein
MDLVFIKYTIVFHCMTLQNLLKFGFLVWKQTILQPSITQQIKGTDVVGLEFTILKHNMKIDSFVLNVLITLEYY